MAKFLSLNQPPLFSSKLEASIIYVLCSGRFLFLRRSGSNSEGGFWTTPGGKLEKGEAPQIAAQRELFEETGLRAKLETIHALGSYYARKDSFDFRIHLFYVLWNTLATEILLNEREHDRFEWIASQEILSRPLMFGGDECFQMATHQMEKQHVNYIYTA